MNHITGQTLKTLRSSRISALTVLLGFGLLFSATGARAGCATPNKAGTAPAIPFVAPTGEDEGSEHASIVGLWHVIYTATYAEGLPSPPFPSTTPFQFLESYKTWHGDGTEFENAFLPPTAGNICFGVWKEVSNHRVKLHHIGLMFAADGSIANVFTVDEINTVAPNGKSYSGSFHFKLFPPSDVLGTGTPLAEVKGTTAASRISVD